MGGQGIGESGGRRHSAHREGQTTGERHTGERDDRGVGNGRGHVGRDTGSLTLPHGFWNCEAICYSMNTRKIVIYSLDATLQVRHWRLMDWNIIKGSINQILQKTQKPAGFLNFESIHLLETPIMF